MPEATIENGVELTAETYTLKGILMVLLVIVCGAFAGGWYLIDRIDQKASESSRHLAVAVEKISESTQRIDKTFTSYMAANTQKINGINVRIDRCEASDRDHEQRIRTLELELRR